MKKEALENKLDEDFEAMKAVEQFNQKVASNPKLKMKLKQARDYLESHPEAAVNVDPKFIQGLQLLQHNILN